MQAQIPNMLTIGRLVLAVAFIALLSVYRFPSQQDWALPVSMVVFIVAAVTDALDGFLARRWNVVSVFGRIADPAADKILVLGAFVLLCSPAFYDTESGIVVSGVAPWMAVLILARELVVTTIRAVVESSGASFAAVWSGKWKMIAQSVSVPMILAVVWLAEPSSLRSGPARTGLLGIAWAVVLITALSGLHYGVIGGRALRTSKTP